MSPTFSTMRRTTALRIWNGKSIVESLSKSAKNCVTTNTKSRNRSPGSLLHGDLAPPPKPPKHKDQRCQHQSHYKGDRGCFVDPAAIPITPDHGRQSNVVLDPEKHRHGQLPIDQQRRPDPDR